jgi:hypothetical protein
LLVFLLNTVYILPKHPHITKPTQTHTLQNPHIRIHTHTLCTRTHLQNFLIPRYTLSVFMYMNVGTRLAHSAERKSSFKIYRSKGSQGINRILWRMMIRYLARFAVLAAVSLGKEFPTFRKLMSFSLGQSMQGEESLRCVRIT